MSSSTDFLTALDSPSERRFYTRSTPSRPIYIPFGGNNLCILLNLSENGFLISTPVGLDRNSVYRVSIRLNGVPRPIEVPVRTIWTTKSRERAGIQMLDLSDHDREQIRKWQALEGSREKAPDVAAAPLPVQSEPRDEKSVPPSVPAIPESSARPALRAVATAAISAATPPIVEQLRNTHLDSLRSQTGATQRHKKKSEAATLFAWILVGAVTFIGIALLVRPDLFGKILTLSPSAASRSVETLPNAPEPLKELEVKDVPPSAKPAAATSAPPIYPTPDSALRPNANTISTQNRAANATSSTDSPAASRNHFSLASSPRPNLAATPSDNSEIPSAATNSPMRSAGSGTDAANSVPSSFAGKTAAAAPDSQLTNAAPPAVTTAPNATPAPTVPVPVAPAPAGKSAITGSIAEPTPRNNDVVASSTPSATPNTAVPRSTWGSSGPIAAGRSSLLRSRSDSGSSGGVVHMDVAENRVMEITPPRGITSSFVNLPGERVLETSGMTMHIRRAVRVPADRWILHSKKQLSLGELSSRVDPQNPRGGSTYGSITVQAIIDKDGHVSELNPLNGSSAFLPGVTRAVREWQFEPTYLDGKPVETRAEIELNFHPGTNPRP